jgi:hypothetical protein
MSDEQHRQIMKMLTMMFFFQGLWFAILLFATHR